MIAFLSLVLLTVDGFFNLARAPFEPGPTTPTGLEITVNSVEITSDNVFSKERRFTTVFTVFDDDLNIQPSLVKPVDVILKTGQTDNEFGFGIIEQGEYQGVRLTLSAVGRYTGTDPCTGDAVPDAAEIQLPGGSDGQVVINYSVPDPSLGLPSGFLPMQLLRITSFPIEFRLVFRASRSVFCVSSAEPLRTLIGEDTGLNNPFGMYVDTDNNEIGVTNNSDHSVTIYSREANGDLVPIRTIQGDKTQLTNPWGIYVDTDNNEIGVANNGHDSVTIYSRTQIIDNTDPVANVAPIRTIHKDGAGISGPGGIYFDADNDEIVVANGGDDTVTFFNRTAPENAEPKYHIRGDLTGGDLTKLSKPCGVYVDNNEIFVANNGDDSVTVYDRNNVTDLITFPNGNVPPERTIIGLRTGLSNPCGLSVDTVNDEIVVVNNGNNSITIYHRGDRGDVAPKRTIFGNNTGLSNPLGIALYLDPGGDSTKDEIVVTNTGNNSLTVHKRDDATAQLGRLPTLINTADQLSLFPRYSYTGVIDRGTGTTPNDPTGKPVLPQFVGYDFAWRISDPASEQLRQEGDARDATLIPPSDVVFTLTDDTLVSNLPMDCPQFTFAILLQLSTNCPPSPLIRSPFPVPNGVYTVPAILFREITITKFVLTTSPLQPSEFPRPVPTLTLAANTAIEKIDWIYMNEMNEAGEKLASPIILSQNVRITLRDSLEAVSACYEIIAGGVFAPPVVFDSGSLSRDLRSQSEVKNNRCDILLDDVDNLVFTYTDALGAIFIFQWEPG